MRRVRWLVIGAVALALAGAVAAVVTIEPKLSDARDRVDLRWEPLRAPLDARYDALSVMATALHDAGAGDRAVTTALDDALTRWSQLALRGPKHTDVTLETKTANELEALARRVNANVDASDRLGNNDAIKAARSAFAQAVVPVPALSAYNRAVRAYEDERSGTISSLVAGAMGFDARTLLVVAGDS